MEKIRLQKFFSDSGIMSRRACEAEIAAGNVAINGITAKVGDKVDPDRDTVTYRGKRVQAQHHKKYTYVMLNKPRGYITSMTDPQGRRCVTDLLSDLDVRVYPVGRLDRVSEGLLLLTDDGNLTNRLTHPKHSIPKIYRVKVDGHPTKEQIEKLTSPLVIDDYEIQPVEVTVTPEEEDTVLHMSLYEGRNRQIRKMCDACGITIRRLSRVAIGQLRLNGLAVGKWRHLEPEEIDYLYRSTKD
ncbi:MAG: rRNA pseudouridine synthase [Clostridia bacterium]|nr:rRNA pseudouridine synthase [Clostridia bacterium]